MIISTFACAKLSPKSEMRGSLLFKVYGPLPMLRDGASLSEMFQ